MLLVLMIARCRWRAVYLSFPAAKHPEWIDTVVPAYLGLSLNIGLSLQVTQAEVYVHTHCIQCTHIVYVQCVYTVNCTVNSLQCTVYVYSVHFTLYSIHCSVQCRCVCICLWAVFELYETNSCTHCWLWWYLLDQQQTGHRNDDEMQRMIQMMCGMCLHHWCICM